MEITFIHVVGIWKFFPESLDPTFIQNKVVVVRKISIDFSHMLFRSLSAQGPSFTLFRHVGWLNFHDGRKVDIRFNGISNGVAALEANHTFLGILRGILSRMIIILVINGGCGSILHLGIYLYYIHSRDYMKKSWRCKKKWSLDCHLW